MTNDKDESGDLDMVTLFESSAHDAEQESLWIHGLLESNGIPSVIVGAAVIPSLAFRIEVPRALLADARQALQDARAAGPAAAAEAEADSEKGGE